MSLIVRQTKNSAEYEAALALRHEVFVREQGVSPAADRDGRDPKSLQLVALDDRFIVGTCRLESHPGNAMRLGRLAVRESARGRGVASALLSAAEREAILVKAKRITLHAQTRAMELYVRAGYSVVGDRFIEEGIEHVSMEKSLVRT